MTSERGRTIHGKAENLREDGHPEEALSVAMEAFIAYSQDGDNLGASEVLASQILALRHLSDKYENKNFLILAKSFTRAGIEIAEESGDKSSLSLPYYDHAKILESLGEFNESVRYYKMALDNFQNNPPKEHKPEGRTSLIADMKVHLHVAEAKAGDESAIDRILEALKELEGGEEILQYNKDVWLSGGYMSLAELLKDKDIDKAKEYLNRAKEIIDSNENLTIRKSQWEKLAQKINS